MASSDSAAFDGKAQDYDAEFTATELGVALRAMVRARFEARFAGHERLLEIGCGTGEDAVFLAQRGHRVCATDASSQMLRVAREKAGRAGVAHRIEFLHVPMESLGVALSGETFDGMYSNFGALNCAENLGSLITDLAPRFAAGAPLVWVVMGRHVPWEWAWYLARGDLRKAFRRIAREGTEWRGLRISYPTPGELALALRPHFTAQAARSLGFLLPPSYAGGFLNRSPKLLALLARFENRIAAFPGSAALADHYILEGTRDPA